MRLRDHYFSGTRWEQQVGYARAVRVGPHVHVSGTTATDERGEIVGLGDPYAQTLQALRNVERALVGLGATLEHVVRTRVFVASVAHWEAVGRAHGEVLGHVRPATTMVQAQLISPDMLVEIEADAIIEGAGCGV